MRVQLIAVRVFLARADHAQFTKAVVFLRRIMGAKAPEVDALVAHQLKRRDAVALADEYLDAIDWPLAGGRAVTTRLAERKILRARRRANRSITGRIFRRSVRPKLPPDPSSN